GGGLIEQRAGARTGTADELPMPMLGLAAARPGPGRVGPPEPQSVLLQPPVSLGVEPTNAVDVGGQTPTVDRTASRRRQMGLALLDRRLLAVAAIAATQGDVDPLGGSGGLHSTEGVGCGRMEPAAVNLDQLLLRDEPVLVEATPHLLPVCPGDTTVRGTPHRLRGGCGAGGGEGDRLLLVGVGEQPLVEGVDLLLLL